MATFEIPFPIGVTVWTPRSNGRDFHYETCPDCNGSGLCTIVFDNGEQYRVGCGGCSTMLDNRGAGEIRTDRYVVYPTEVTLYGVERIEGDVVTYRDRPLDEGCCSPVGSDNLFSTREECAVACERINAEREEERKERLFQHLNSKRKSRAAYVAYWRKRKATSEAELAYLDAKLLQAQTCKKPSVRVAKEQKP